MILAFVPVIHQGYLDFFSKYPGEIGILGSDVIADFTSLTRDCRTVNPGLIKRSIESLGMFSSVRIISKAAIAELAHTQTPIVMPDEDVSRAIVERYGIQHVTFDSVFLRWDKIITTQEHIIAPHRVILRDEFSQSMMNIALTESQKSSDWWRQIGAAIVRDGKILALTHNRHIPTDFHLGAFGDPRSNFDAGERIDLSTAIHSEALAVAQSAKLGISLAGTDLFVTTFPCPNCARLIAEAGIKRVYYAKGYSLLDAETILNAYGIDIALVDLELSPTIPSA